MSRLIEASGEEFFRRRIRDFEYDQADAEMRNIRKCSEELLTRYGNRVSNRGSRAFYTLVAPLAFSLRMTPFQLADRILLEDTFPTEDGVDVGVRIFTDCGVVAKTQVVRIGIDGADLLFALGKNGLVDSYVRSQGSNGVWESEGMASRGMVLTGQARRISPNETPLLREVIDKFIERYPM